MWLKTLQKEQFIRYFIVIMLLLSVNCDSSVVHMKRLWTFWPYQRADEVSFFSIPDDSKCSTGDEWFARHPPLLRTERRVQLRAEERHRTLQPEIIEDHDQRRQPFRSRLRSLLERLFRSGKTFANDSLIWRQDRLVPEQPDPEGLPELAPGGLPH